MTPRPWTRGLSVSLPAVIAAGLITAPSSPVQAAEVTPKAACPADRPDTDAALVTARMCGGPVVIAGLTTETDQAVATPSGAVELRHNFRPVRVRQGSTWVPVDTTLKLGADGRVAATATAAAVSFSGGGTGAMVTVADGATSVGLSSPLGSLPTPVLSGDTATYPEVLPGVDLRLRADVDGYSQVLVVKTAKAAANPKLRQLSFPLSGKGLTVGTDKAGNLRATNPAGKVVLAGNTPLMWDATAAATRGDARPGATVRPAPVSGTDAHEAPMPVTVAAGALTVSPDRALLDGPSTVYPLYIDPGFTVNRAGFSVISSAAPDTAFWNTPDDAFVGSWDGGTSKYRSMFSYDLTGSGLGGKYVSSALLNLNEVYAATCQPAGFEVWSTPIPTSTTTWNNQPAWYGQQSTSTVSKGYSPAGVGGASNCPAGVVPMDVTSYMQSAATNGWNGVAFGVRATSETDPNSWKRFSNNPTLTITYTGLPTTTAGATTPSTPCVTGANRPYLNTTTPVLQARVNDPEGASVQSAFEWTTIAGTAVGSAQPATTAASGQAFSTTIPAGQLVNDGSYAWRVHGSDGTTWGPWSAPCEFTVDTTAPTTAPTVSSSTYPAGTWSAVAGTPGTFTLGANGTADISAYLYGLDTDPTTVINAATLGAGVSLSLTPATDGPHTLKVQSRDRGGNLSPVTTYSFSVGTGAVTSPTTGTQTAGKVTLSGLSKTTSTGITYQWRRGDADTWTTIPTADVTTTGGTAITWPVATSGSGTYPNLVWNVAQTVNNAETGPDPLDGPVQVRASLSGSTTGTSTGVLFTLDRNRADGATAQIGPGSVNLLTGNYTVGASDVSTIGGLGVQRTFNTRLAGDVDPLFGPGWTSSVGVPDAGSYTELKVTGSLVQVGLTDGGLLGFTKKATTSSGATFTPEIGAGNTTLIYTTTGDTYTLTEESGDTVTFSRRSTDPAGLYTPTAMKAAGTSATGSTMSWEKVTVGGVDVVRPTSVLAPVPAGVSCATLVKGCQALTFTYATATTATSTTVGDYLGRIKQISLTAWDPALATPAMRTVVLAAYAYDTTGRLRQGWDPRLDWGNSNGTQHFGDAYTYNADGTLATLTPPGVEPWSLTYTSIPTDTGAGRLYKVTRSALSAGTAVQTIVYNMPITGTSAPVDMTMANRWGQTAIPVDATAVYPGDIVPNGNPATGTLPTPTNDDRITVTYMDTNGRTTNTMSPGGTVDATFYDAYGNIVQSITGSNLAEALYASTTDTPAQETALARIESTLNTYSADGQRLLETLAPQQQTVLSGWNMVRGRTHNTYTYDEGATGTGPYNLVTTAVESLQYVAAGVTVDADKRTTTSQYDWTLRQPTTTVVDPTGLALTTRATYDSTTGQVTSTTAPAGDAAGATPSTRKTVYYRTGTGSGFTECDNHPEWALLPCRTYTGGQPGTGPELPYTLATYDMYGQIAATIEKNSTSTLRTVAVTADAAGRPVDLTITSSLGTAIAKQRTLYAPATGYPYSTQSLDGNGNFIAGISRGYDTLGRLTSYQDADGNTSTTTFDLLSRPIYTSDGKGTQTISYNGGGEKRGLPTQIIDSQAGTFIATYHKDGTIDTETRPDGTTVKHYNNENSQNTGIEYLTTPTCTTASCNLYYDYADYDGHQKIRWNSSTFSNSGYTYDNVGRLIKARQDLTTVCALRSYTFDNASNRTQLATYSPDTSGACQESNPATNTRNWTYDTADRATNTGYAYDALGRTVTVPAQDTGNASAAATMTYYANDMSRTIVQGSTTTTNTLDVMTDRFAGYATTTGGTTVNHTNHYSTDNDSPTWITEGSGYTRVISGLAGTAAQYTGASAHLEWQIIDLHGDVVAMASGGTVGLTATYTFDEYGKAVTPTSRYGYLGAAQRSADNAANMITMGVRLYNPTTGRFLSIDPVYGGNANPYVYPTDPINMQDASGKIAIALIPAIAIGILGAGTIALIAYYLLHRKIYVPGTHIAVPFPSTVAAAAAAFATMPYVVYEIFKLSTHETWKYGITRQNNWQDRPGSQISRCTTHYRSQCAYRKVAAVTGWYTARFIEASLFFKYAFDHHKCPDGAPFCI